MNKPDYEDLIRLICDIHRNGDVDSLDLRQRIQDIALQHERWVMGGKK